MLSEGRNPRFRERFPLVEVTVLNMDNRTQVEALENGRIMLGIGYAGSDLAESESLTVTPLFRCSFSIACAEHRNDDDGGGNRDEDRERY